MHRIVILVLGLLLSSNPVLAGAGCSEIYPATDGWAIDLCATDPNVPVPMAVTLDGASQGNAALVRVYHRTNDGTSTPQVAVFYASGFIRLKPNADPAPPIPFGSSFILGPAYWSDASTYHHNPQLMTFEIDTSYLPGGPLRLTAAGTNQDFDVTYAMALPKPRDRLTRLHVLQTHTATAGVSIDATRRSEAQGFKLVQVSSMYVNEGATCDGGLSDCHDSDGARFLSGGRRTEVAFADLTAPSFVFTSPGPLSSGWLDTLHGDDLSWQGDTPNVRMALDPLPGDRTVTPQGYVNATTDPNDDNLNLWLHDDGTASQSWSLGESDQVGYWLAATDDPPRPWDELGLRPGLTFLDMESGLSCTAVRDAGQSTSVAVAAIDGYADRALELGYDLGSDNGNWAQIRCDFDPPLDLTAYDHLRFDWRGSAGAANSLEVALISHVDGEDRIFGRGFHHAAQRAWWGQMVLPFRFLPPWTPGTTLDPSQIKAFFVSVVKDPVADPGGAGSLAIDDVGAFDVASRSVPASPESVAPHAAAAAAAAGWLAGQQQVTGLVKSWEEEASCVSHTYDQALALLVFVDAGSSSAADAVAGALAATQNPNGSWFKSRDCLTLDPVGTDEWEGDVAWAIFALGRYLEAGGSHPQAASVRDAAADWLLTRVAPDGCLLIDHTEGMIDAWWAFITAGPPYASAAAGIAGCLRQHYWEPVMGRLKGGRDWWQPYLDNQTWGGAFLRARGYAGDDLRALSYAYEVLRLPAQNGVAHGFDGQGGPWALWNEGTAQYAALGGEGAADFLDELLAQQRADGAMPSSPDDFAGGGVWTSRWHGVAPTSWLYFALTGGPFPETAGEIFADGFESGDVSVWSSAVGDD